MCKENKSLSLMKEFDVRLIIWVFGRLSLMGLINILLFQKFRTKCRDYYLT
jgi:hypothetical protein